MATVKDSMRSFVAGSVDDHAGTIGRQSGGPDEAPRSSIQRQGDGRRRLEGAGEIRLDRIAPDRDQPRQEFDEVELHQLAESIRERGVLQPIRVRWDDAADRYVVVVGERRYRAARLVGLESIPCVVATGQASSEDILEDQLLENCLRMDLKPLEKARAYKRLLDARGSTQRQLAERLHVSQTAISQALALLELPGPIREAVDAGEIAPEVGYHLTKVEDHEERETLAREAAEGRLRRDDIRERAVVTRKATSAKGRGAGKAKARKVTSRTLRTSAGFRVTVEHRRGVDDQGIRAALVDALGQLDAAGQGRGEAAA
jgi:ParB family transcriptional regulator, chromosome partitioning protein